jgi:hypothetical protein
MDNMSSFDSLIPVARAFRLSSQTVDLRDDRTRSSLLPVSHQGHQFTTAYPAAVEGMVATPAQAQEVHAHVQALASSHSSGEDVMDI